MKRLTKPWPHLTTNNIRTLKVTMITRVLALACMLALSATNSHSQNTSGDTWRFAVSGDSRNWGDVVMPAIAKSVLEKNAQFYWHLGDFRIGYAIDEDIKNRIGSQMTAADYPTKAWDDFISEQISPFGSLPVHLGIGNHELYLRGTTADDQNLSHTDFLVKFIKWLDGSKTAYYHWKVKQVDFINLDNSQNTGFDADQLAWLESILKEDSSNAEIKSVVVGMHRALPNSLACGHSMNGDPSSSAEDNRKSTESGRAAYRYLWSFQNTTGKTVYTLASHSHFFMGNIFNTPYWNNKDEKQPAILKDRNEKPQSTLKGWLIGTAGAMRYRLPDNMPATTPALTYVYGYLLGEVSSDGRIQFEFQQITEDGVPSDTRAKYRKEFLDACFLQNRDDTPHPPEESCNEQ
jgi:hypothetical protein